MKKMGKNLFGTPPADERADERAPLPTSSVHALHHRVAHRPTIHRALAVRIVSSIGFPL